MELWLRTMANFSVVHLPCLRLLLFHFDFYVFIAAFYVLISFCEREQWWRGCHRIWVQHRIHQRTNQQCRPLCSLFASKNRNWFFHSRRKRLNAKNWLLERVSETHWHTRYTNSFDRPFERLSKCHTDIPVTNKKKSNFIPLKGTASMGNKVKLTFISVSLSSAFTQSGASWTISLWCP